MKTAVQTALLLAFVLAGSTHMEAAVVLDSKVAILVGSEEPQPVQLAAQDLAGDCEKVLGRKPAIVHDVHDAAPVTILIGFRSALVHDLRPAELSAPESFSISVSPVHWLPKQCCSRAQICGERSLRFISFHRIILASILSITGPIISLHGALRLNSMRI